MSLNFASYIPLLEVAPRIPDYLYLPLLMALMSLATLFVYRPEKFKALPWIVLAIMGLVFFSMALNECTIALLGGVEYGGIMMITFGSVIGRFFWIGKANLWLVDSSVYAVVSAIPILALWVMLIVGAVQKKKKES